MDWPPPRDRWFAGYTAGQKGWCRSYRGTTLACGGKYATRDEVERTFFKKARERDDLLDRGIEKRTDAPYWKVLSEFLALCELRVQTGKPRPLSKRTLFNYVNELNKFGKFINANTLMRDIGPDQLSAYARAHGEWKASGFDSMVTRISALFNFAVEAEYIDRFRPGPAFQRPARQEIRDQRIAKTMSFTPGEVAKLLAAAGPTMKLWVSLGVCAAFNNSDIAHLTRDTVDLKAGIIDFRRRKTGKVRRVIPLPEEVVKMMEKYQRPDPKHERDAGLFFLSRYGNPFDRSAKKEDFKPNDSIGRMFARLMDDAAVEHRSGRGFKGLRTTFANLAPVGYREEALLVMGHSKGTTFLDHYLEVVGLDRIRHVVDSVWEAASKSQVDAPDNQGQQVSAA